MYLRPIERLQIDFSSICNAGCLFCSRQDFFGSLNPNFPKNKTLPLALFQKAILDPYLSQLKEVFYCGNYGDALGSPEISDHLSWLAKERPHIRWNIHTNGSLGSLDFWKYLGDLSSSQKGLVKFSIDGLKDTNGIYRKNTDFDRILRNAKEFIASGGRAVWKFIEFQHNRHQIEEAKRMAKELGFLRFELRQNYAKGEESYLFRLPDSPPLDEELVASYRRQSQHSSSLQISCKAQMENNLYIDFDGQVWPCCWLHDWKYSPTKVKRNWHEEYFLPWDKGGFNQLERNSLSEILQHPWFRTHLPESWSSDNGHLHPSCVATCGKKGNAS